MKLKSLFSNLLGQHAAPHTPWKEKMVSSLGAFGAILLLTIFIHKLSADTSLPILVLASMGASTFLLFVAPHSPMAQPWPVLGGHLLSAAVGVACAHWIGQPELAAATAVGVSVLGMHILRCLHPPSAATALIAVLGGTEIHALGWSFCYEVVGVNALVLVALAIVINTLIADRRYPMLHSHHPHHTQYAQTPHPAFADLDEQDFRWALEKIDGFIDISEEDLIDLYEFAVEHAQQRARSAGQGAS